MTAGPKIIITGSGRAGTSMLVQLLTRLGFDTGFEPYKEKYNPLIRCGCETGRKYDGTPIEWYEQAKSDPRILKSPKYAAALKYILHTGAMTIEHVIIPVRDLHDSAVSRVNAGLGGWPVEGNDPLEIEEGLAWVLGKAIEACVIYRVPFTLMRFPDFVGHKQYCYDCLCRIFPLEWGTFSDVYDELADPSMIQTVRRPRNGSYSLPL